MIETEGPFHSSWHCSAGRGDGRRRGENQAWITVGLLVTRGRDELATMSMRSRASSSSLHPSRPLVTIEDGRNEFSMTEAER